MSHPLIAATVPVRDDLFEAFGIAWSELGAPGPWLDGRTRLAVAAEVRRARDCALCACRKKQLSPYASDAAHDHDTASDLPLSWIDAIHRITTDPGRLTRTWFASLVGDDLLEEEFIEIVSVVVRTITADVFTLGIDAPMPQLPPELPGSTHRQRRPEAKPGPGWVSTIAPEDAHGEFTAFYANDSHFYIRRSLTLLPDESVRLWDYLNTLYMADPRVFELEGLDRAIDRAQVEFIAARASAVLGCYY